MAAMAPLAETSLVSRLFACLSYGTVSVCITLFNKAVFSVYKFQFPSFVTTLQILVSIFYLLLLRRAKVMEFGMLTWQQSKQVTSNLPDIAVSR